MEPPGTGSPTSTAAISTTTSVRGVGCLTFRFEGIAGAARSGATVSDTNSRRPERFGARASTSVEEATKAMLRLQTKSWWWRCGIQRRSVGAWFRGHNLIRSGDGSRALRRPEQPRSDPAGRYVQQRTAWGLVHRLCQVVDQQQRTECVAAGTRLSCVDRWRPRGALRRRSSAAADSLPPHVPIKMPALSPTMKAGNLLAWKRREGEPVTAGDVLAEIETDKATIEFESQEEGILAKILVPDGTQDVPVGTLIAVLAEDEEHVSALQRMDWNSATKPESTSVQRQRYALATEMQQQQQQQQASSGSTEADTSMTQQLEQESEPLPWRYGPAVATMLANHELPAALVQRLQPSGPRGHVLKGDLLRVLAAAKGSGAASTRRDSQSAAEVQRSSSSFVSSTPHGPGTGTAAEGSRVLPSREHQQVPTSSSPSPAAATPPTTTTQFRDIPLSQVRRVIAERLLESKQKAPHAYQSIVVNFEALLELRQTINMLAANSLQALRTPKLTVNDLLLRAVAIALREHRSLNTNAERVDLAFAVATPTGLITPIIHDADTKSVSVIAAESQDLVQRARQNKLKLHEFQGGSFSISNLGMVPAIARFTAIINPPQAGILAIGAPQRRLVPRAANLTSHSSVEPLDTERLRFATLTLSYDAGRVQRTASLAFLQDLQRLIESPSWLLV